MRATLWTAVIVLALGPVVCLAGTTGANSSPYAALNPPASTQPTGPDSLNQGAVHFDMGADFETADFFRGIRQPVNSPSIQGYVDVYLNLCKFGDANLGAYVGIRDGGSEKSHNGAPLTDYLQEVFAGFDVQCHCMSMDIGYVEHHSPDGTFASQNEVGARLEYDDTEMAQAWHCPILLQPHIEIFREVLDQASGISSRSEPGNQNSYLEIGIAPQHTFTTGPDCGCGVTVAMPITAGMSWDNYYSLTPAAKSNVLGFVSVGAMASAPLPVPSKYGAWDLRGGITYVNDTAQGARLIDHGHAYFLTEGLGLEMRY